MIVIYEIDAIKLKDEFLILLAIYLFLLFFKKNHKKYIFVTNN